MAQERGTLAHEKFLAQTRKLNPCVASDGPVQTPSAIVTRHHPLRSIIAMIVTLLMNLGERKR
jgi:hypothetical protein